jgi:hypothetical protein
LSRSFTGRPFLGVKTWREFKAPVFDGEVMLMTLLEFITYKVGLMIHKANRIICGMASQVPLFFSDTTLLISKFSCGWPEEKIHAHPRSLLNAASCSLFKEKTFGVLYLSQGYECVLKLTGAQILLLILSISF